MSDQVIPCPDCKGATTKMDYGLFCRKCYGSGTVLAPDALPLLDVYALTVMYPRLGYSCQSCVKWRRRSAYYGSPSSEGRCVERTSDYDDYDKDTHEDYLCLEYSPDTPQYEIVTR